MSHEQARNHLYQLALDYGGSTVDDALAGAVDATAIADDPADVATVDHVLRGVGQSAARRLLKEEIERQVQASVGWIERRSEAVATELDYQEPPEASTRHVDSALKDLPEHYCRDHYAALADLGTFVLRFNETAGDTRSRIVREFGFAHDRVRSAALGQGCLDSPHEQSLNDKFGRLLGSLGGDPHRVGLDARIHLGEVASAWTAHVRDTRWADGRG